MSERVMYLYPYKVDPPSRRLKILIDEEGVHFDWESRVYEDQHDEEGYLVENGPFREWKFKEPPEWESSPDYGARIPMNSLPVVLDFLQTALNKS